MTPAGDGRTSSLLLMLGIFLKLLGFFIVLFSYAEFEPNKMRQAEFSLKQQFNVSIPLSDMVRSGRDIVNLAPVQNLGHAYDNLEAELKTQMDLLAVERRMKSGDMTLTIRADQILDMNGQLAKGRSFPEALYKTMEKNRPHGVLFMLDIVARGPDKNILMRGIGDFAQNMIVAGHNQKFLSIGYENSRDEPVVVVRIRGVTQ
jgi:hypothetical protein